MLTAFVRGQHAPFPDITLVGYLILFQLPLCTLSDLTMPDPIQIGDFQIERQIGAVYRMIMD